MKNIVLLIFLSLCLTVVAQNKKKRILIFAEINHTGCPKNAAEIAASTLPNKLASLLRKELPCFEIILKSDLVDLIKFDRQWVLSGYGDESNLAEIIGQFNCDYFIQLQISCINDKIMITGTRMNERSARVLNRQTEIGNNENGEFVEKFANDFLENILYSEPCPYKGSIHIEDLETMSTDSIVEKNISCGNLAGTNGTEKFTSKEKRNISRKIELNKINKTEAEGSYTSTMNSEYYSTYVNNDCYVCSMDGTDATVITTGDFSDEVTENSRWNISGIASYKTGEDSLVKISEVAIHFAKNGTYTVEVKAVSNYGPFEGSRTTKTNSTCGGQKTKNDDPISYRTNDTFKFNLGPFKGSPFDKRLKENGTMDVSMKNSKEKHKITFGFGLTRD
jgi:hypothetical protein